MLLVGMSNLKTYIETGKTKYEPLEQLDSRIKFRLDLSAVANQEDGGPGLYTIDDIRKWLAAQKIKVGGDVERYLQMIANEPGLGGLRTCDGLLRVAAEIAGDKPITAEMLREILAEQRGARFVESFEQQVEIRLVAGTLYAAGLAGLCRRFSHGRTREVTKLNPTEAHDLVEMLKKVGERESPVVQPAARAAAAARPSSASRARRPAPCPAARRRPRLVLTSPVRSPHPMRTEARTLTKSRSKPRKGGAPAPTPWASAATAPLIESVARRIHAGLPPRCSSTTSSRTAPAA
jgi:hypothetical protein